MTYKNGDLFLYMIKCLIGVAAGFYIYRAWPEVGAWCLVSIVLVLSPDRKDAFNLAFNRIKANGIGAGIGLILFFIHPMNLFVLSVGVLLAILTCQWLKLQEASRSAAVAVVIILLHEKGRYFWDTALERAGGVFIGCLIAILITYVFHVTFRRSNF